MALRQATRVRLHQTVRHYAAMDVLRASRSRLRFRMLMECSVNPLVSVQRPPSNSAPLHRSSASGHPIDAAAPTITLAQSMREQLYSQSLSDRELLLGEWLIDALDADGFFRQPIEAVTSDINAWLDKEDKQHRVPRMTPREVLSVLRVLQSFEPPGIAARTLAECYLLQLELLGEDDEIITRILRTDPARIEAGDWDGIAERAGLCVEIVQTSAKRLDRLPTCPGDRFLGTEVHEPDGCIELIDGQPRAYLYQDDLRVIKEQSKTATPADREQANHLLDGLTQRDRTLQTILEHVAQEQHDAFVNGLERLKPLTRRTIANKMQIDETRVGRAVADTHIQTPGGIFPLSGFFSKSTVKWRDGRLGTSIGVKVLMRELLNAEQPTAPLKDSEIKSRLGSMGVDISQRTVQTYRSEMGVKSFRERRLSNAITSD